MRAAVSGVGWSTARFRHCSIQLTSTLVVAAVCHRWAGFARWCPTTWTDRRRSRDRLTTPAEAGTRSRHAEDIFSDASQGHGTCQHHGVVERLDLESRAEPRPCLGAQPQDLELADLVGERLAGPRRCTDRPRWRCCSRRARCGPSGSRSPAGASSRARACPCRPRAGRRASKERIEAGQGPE